MRATTAAHLNLARMLTKLVALTIATLAVAAAPATAGVCVNVAPHICTPVGNIHSKPHCE